MQKAQESLQGAKQTAEGYAQQAQQAGLGQQAGQGQQGGVGKMTQEAASRIQSAADTNPQSQSAQSGFKERAQSAAAQGQKEV